MPKQRDRRVQRAITRWFFAALFLCTSFASTACPLCLGAFRSSVAQQWVGVGAVALEHEGWLRQIAAGKRSSDMNVDEWRDRVALMWRGNTGARCQYIWR